MVIFTNNLSQDIILNCPLFLKKRKGTYKKGKSAYRDGGYCTKNEQ